MPRKKKRGYGDYTEYIDGELYASVSIPIGGNKYKRKRKKVDTKTDARNWALDQLDKAKHGITSEGFETFGDLVEWYKSHFLVAPVIEHGVKIEGSTDWQKSRDKLDRMKTFFGSKRLKFITEQDFLAYSRERRKKVSQATINRDLALLRSMFRKGREADHSIKLPRFPIIQAAEKERDRVMSFAEEKAILAACDEVELLTYERKGKTVTAKHKTNRGHLRNFVIVAVDTALRRGEITKLQRSDVNFKTKVITVRKEISKTGKTRKVPMTTRVLEILKTSLPFEIKSCYKAFNTACERAKIKDLTFHDLRHTATTRMIASGTPHMEVMKITGHTQIKTFLRYLNPEDETVLAAASRLDALLNK